MGAMCDSLSTPGAVLRSTMESGVLRRETFSRSMDYMSSNSDGMNEMHQILVCFAGVLQSLAYSVDELLPGWSCGLQVCCRW